VHRRRLLAYAGLMPLPFIPALAEPAAAAGRFRRVRPSDGAWPSAASWNELNQKVGGHLIKVEPLLAACSDKDSNACQDVLKAATTTRWL
jgi:hypothetical protein